ncbi:MAG: IPT/TIG domain-containing protein [Actinomycetota bacterium]|nr:IPT/TIG domain-containing protein [Actinomycetota bacterium]
MARRLLILLSLLTCASLGTALDASAAKKKSKKAKNVTPTVRSIVPMKAQVGEKLTITGTNFIPGEKKTVVYFHREGGGVVWTRADTATKTRLIVTVPDRIISLLRGTAENREPTRFMVRIRGKKFGALTKLAKSPFLTAPNAAPPAPGDPGTPAPAPGTPPDGDCDGDGMTNGVDPDDDNDALTDDLEVLPAHTDPCKADTDGDQVADGYEYYSAKDINVAALPYPAKKPWPNPLDSGDAGIDHDGDGLTMTDEFLLWKYYGNLSVPLNYSAGLQKSADVDAPTALAEAHIDMDSDGKLSDDERDGDGDGINNWDESHGRMLQDWWDLKYNGQNYLSEKETRYPLTYPGVSIFDPDSDGDGVKDGDDDQDHDGLTNRFENARPANWVRTVLLMGMPQVWPFASPENPWSRVQPYNPCKPVRSHACHLHPDFGYYDLSEEWAGIDRADAGPVPTAPWDYPGSTLPDEPSNMFPPLP